MKAILLKNVKKGNFFLLSDKVKYNEDGEVLSKYVLVKDDYERSTKHYWVHKFDDCNSYRLFKPTTIVYIDFIF